MRGASASREKRGRGGKGKRKTFFPASPHSLLVSFPNLHNINSSARRGFQEQKPTTRSLPCIVSTGSYSKFSDTVEPDITRKALNAKRR